MRIPKWLDKIVTKMDNVKIPSWAEKVIDSAIITNVLIFLYLIIIIVFITMEVNK